MEWERVERIGRCPSCGTFYDSRVEGKVKALALDPSLRRENTRDRIWSFATGFGLVAIGVIWLGLWILAFHRVSLFPVFVAGAGGVRVLFGILHNSESAARSRLSARPDLDRLSSKD